MSEIKICANKTCKESSRNSTLQFFAFPKKIKTFRLWSERSGRKDLMRKPPQTLKPKYFLCEKHFNKFDILLNGKKSLPYDAMPLEFGKIFKQDESRFRTLKNSPDTSVTKNSSKPLRKSLNTVTKLSDNTVDAKISSKSEKNPGLFPPITSVAKKRTGRLPERSAVITKLSTNKPSNSNQGEKEFNVDVFKNVDAREIAEYKKLFPKLENIADRPVHCTSCNSHIGTAPINEAIIKMHPVLRVIQCKKCYTFYTSGEFERGEDGSEFYCRWCGQGGEVYCCSKCPKVYCRRCIEQNLSKSKVDEIQNNENWICFACDPACMTQLKADYWALLNFIEKQKKDITNKSLTERELNEAMSKDCAKCCLNIKKRMYGKRKFPNSAESTPPFKRQDTGVTPEPPTIINDALAKRAQSKKAVSSEEIKVQCQPDIGSILNAGDKNSPPNTPTVNTSPPQIRLVRQLKVVPVTSTPHSGQSVPQTVPQNLLLDVHTAPPTKNPVFHTINGFRVDLNTAAQQETYRLPNGKLIQVRKQQPTLPNTSKISTSNSATVTTPMVSSSNVAPPTLTPSKPTPQTVTMTKPTPPTPIPPLLRVPPPLVIPTPTSVRPAVALSRQVSRGRGRGRPSLPLTQTHSKPSSVQAKQLIQIRRNPSISEPNYSLPPENEIHITSLSQTIRKRKKPGNPPTVQVNSPVDKAKSQFENRVENSMEVCQHIIGKMKTLTSSTAFKSVKTLTDVKDLTIHLSYLLTYAVGRFKTLQEKCGGDMKVMGFDPDSAKSDDDDIEILEPSTTLIELDSDGNDGDDTERETRKAVENLLTVENADANVLKSVENVAESATVVIHQNGEENNATETIDLIEIADDQPETNDKTAAETLTANGYDIVELHETASDDKSNKGNSNKDDEKSKDTAEMNKSESGISDKHDTDQNSEHNRLEPVLKDQTAEIDKDPTKDSEKENENNITNVDESILAESSIPSNDTVTEKVTKDAAKIETGKMVDIFKSESQPDEKNEKTEPDIGNESSKFSENVEILKESENNVHAVTDPEHIKTNDLIKDHANKAPTNQDTETEQLQKLLEESDEIESPSIENLSGELNGQLPSKKGTNSEITINVSNVESIDEDIFENLIEEVNEVGDNTNDESLVSEINETSENSVNADDNILEEIGDKDFDKSKDPQENLMETEPVEDLSESEDIVHDENDLDLSLSSEIVLDPESDKVDDEMEGIIEEDEKNVGGIEYLEEEIAENYEVITETSDSMMEPTIKEPVGIDSSL